MFINAACLFWTYSYPCSISQLIIMFTNKSVGMWKLFPSLICPIFFSAVFCLKIFILIEMVQAFSFEWF